MRGFTHTFLNTSSHGKQESHTYRNCLFVKADAVKFLLKSLKNWKFISPQMLSMYLFYSTVGSIVPAGSP